jgi:hypothetical protein
LRRPRRGKAKNQKPSRLPLVAQNRQPEVITRKSYQSSVELPTTGWQTVARNENEDVLASPDGAIANDHFAALLNKYYRAVAGTGGESEALVALSTSAAWASLIAESAAEKERALASLADAQIKSSQPDKAARSLAEIHRLQPENSAIIVTYAQAKELETGKPQEDFNTKEAIAKEKPLSRQELWPLGTLGAIQSVSESCISSVSQPCSAASLSTPPPRKEFKVCMGNGGGPSCVSGSSADFNCNAYRQMGGGSKQTYDALSQRFCAYEDNGVPKVAPSRITVTYDVGGGECGWTAFQVICSP